METSTRTDLRRHLLRSETEQRWDAELSDLFSLDDAQHSTQEAFSVNGTLQQTVSSDADLDETAHDLFGGWLSAPDQWTSGTSETRDRIDNVAPNTSDTLDTSMEDQIDELRRTVTVLVNHQQQTQAAVGLRYTAAPAVPSPLRDFFDLPSGINSHPSSGYITPVEPLEFSDDSPMFSRRASTASITSVPAKRGPRRPGFYACDKCNSRFDVPSQLKHHSRKHVPKDERPHACAECGDRFLYPKDVARHMRQKHSTGPTEQDIAAGGTLQHYDGHVNSGQHSPEERRNRRRHQQRDRRSTYVRHLEASFRQHSNLISELHSGSSTPDPRRDSGVTDVSADDTNDTHLLEVAKHKELVRDLSNTVERQKQTIQYLERELHTTTENAKTWQTERDAFAEFFQHMSATFDYQSGEQMDGTIDTSSLKERAKGWLSAIEMFTSTSSNRGDDQDSRTHSALRHLASVLDTVET